MKKNPVIKWLIILGIIVISNMIFNYSLSIVLQKPNIDSVCIEEDLIEHHESQDECVLDGGTWEEVYLSDLESTVTYCSTYSKCISEFESLNVYFEQKTFFALATFGAIILVLSLLINNPTLSIAFAAASFVDFIFATIRYWEYSDDGMRVLILFVALLVLIFSNY